MIFEKKQETRNYVLNDISSARRRMCKKKIQEIFNFLNANELKHFIIWIFFFIYFWFFYFISFMPMYLLVSPFNQLFFIFSVIDDIVYERRMLSDEIRCRR